MPLLDRLTRQAADIAARDAEIGEIAITQPLKFRDGPVELAPTFVSTGKVIEHVGPSRYSAAGSLADTGDKLHRSILCDAK